jgi:hypothetical protein
MKITVFAILALSALSVSAQTYVNPYVKKDGTYVEGHYKSSPNSTKMDNYSTQGNSNPFTGQQGTVDPYKTPSTSTYGQQTCGVNSNGNYVCR